MEGQDLVHLFLPFKLHNVCRIFAQQKGIAVTSAFHIVPQNVTSAMHLGKVKFINDILLYSFKKYLYNQIRYVHCPSQMAADLMKKHHFKNNVPCVISNGVIPFFHPIEVAKPKEYQDKFIVSMSARLVDEKRQDLIIKAVAKSKYNDKIQIILCGRGQNEGRYLRLAKKRHLANPLIIKFCDKDELRNVYNYIDLYIHASDYEIEGISCIEAISCGAVPLISNHPYCATKDYALDKSRNTFKHGSPTDLMKKIDWFYEHQDELKKMKKEYLDYSSTFALDKQVDALEKMFITAYNEQKEGKDLHSIKPRKKDERLLRRYLRSAKKQELHPEKYGL